MLTSYERKQQRRDRIVALYLRYRRNTANDTVDTAAATSIQMVFGYPADEIREAVASMPRPVRRPGEYPVGCMAYDAGRMA